MVRFCSVASLLLVSAGWSAIGQPAPAGAPTTQPPAGTAVKAQAPKPGDLKKYDDVITKEAKSQSGLFKVHQIDDKCYWEIPAEKLGRVLLWQTEIAELPNAIGYPGTAAGVRTVRFTRRNNKIQLRDASFDVRATGDEGSRAGVAANSIEPVLMTFDVLTEGEGKAAVIDVTGLFTSDPQDFAVKGLVGGAGVDPGKSYIDRVKAFPTNIETRSFLTMMRGGGRSFNPFGGGGTFNSSMVSIVVHYSLVELPKEPMMGRLKDSRIGYFTTGFTTYGRPENRSVDQEFINRFRLEKKDPSAAVSEPVKPITFYLAREVPVKWRACIRAAIEDWRPAFEQAGFRNAIVAKDAPSVKEDPTWDAEDARYSVIRWAPSTTANAIGPSIQDPRSGETISAHVIIWNDVVSLVENWYFSQAAGIDPAGRKLPFDDALMQKLIRYVVAHEVGHTLGLEHNFRASTSYSIAQLRNPEFTRTHGVASSIMSYSRYNYVAQPGDGVTQTIGMIGPYDKFAIEYGYKPIAGANTPDEEKGQLDTILARQVDDPFVRFGNYKFSGIDPTMQNENISNDPVEAGRLGLANLVRIANQYLIPATTRFGEDYTRLQEFHGALVGQWRQELFHIVPLIGGVVEVDSHAGRGSGEVFQAVPAARQAAAVKFLTTTAMQPIPALFPRAVMSKIQPAGNVDAITGTQTTLLAVLLSESRLKRLQDGAARNGEGSYTVERLLDDLTSNVWSELTMPTVTVSIYRRTLQRAYLRTIDGRINGGGASRTDLKPLARMALRQLLTQVEAASKRTQDRLTAAHLADCRMDIRLILDNRFAPGSPAPAPSIFDALGYQASDRCWAEHMPASIQEAIRDMESASPKKGS